jgi:hypothetical protein
MAGYWNEINPKETREIIQNERDCFRTRAESDAALEAHGRFKKTNETTVVGAAPVQYPALPSGPWSEPDPGAPDPATDQLGYGIDEQDPILPTSSSISERSPSDDLSPGGDVGSNAPTTRLVSEVAGQGEGRPHSPAAFPNKFKRRF